MQSSDPDPLPTSAFSSRELAVEAKILAAIFAAKADELARFHDRVAELFHLAPTVVYRTTRPKASRIAFQAREIASELEDAQRAFERLAEAELVRTIVEGSLP